MIKIGELNQSILGSKVVLQSGKQKHQRQGIRGKAAELQKGHICKGTFREGSPTPKRKAEKKVEKVSENVFAV